MRAETGPMRFGDDWPGLFIRGDESLHLGLVLKRFLEEVGPDFIDSRRVDYFDLTELKGLVDRLNSVENEACKDSATALKTLEKCKEPQ